MPSATNLFQPHPSGITLNIFGTTTVLLNILNSGAMGTVTDPDDALLEPGDSVTLTGGAYTDEPMTVSAVGTARVGLTVLTLGPPFQVAILTTAGGDSYYFWPDGPPNLLGNVVMVLDLDGTPGNTVPLCFVAGTPLLTTGGYKKVEDLRPGDQLVDWTGQAVRILWSAQQRIGNLTDPKRAHLRPITFSADSFDRKNGTSKVRVSGNHRMMLSGPDNALNFGAHDVLAPAKAFVDGHRAYVEDYENTVDYYHVLCERHTVVCAAGIWSETLLLGPVSQGVLGTRQMAKIDKIARENAALTVDQVYDSCLPVLTKRETELIARDEWHQCAGQHTTKAA